MDDVLADHRGAQAPVPGVAGTERRRAAALLAIGGLGLAIGVLVYVTDRAATHSLLIPPIGALSGRHWFGPIALWLPSFVHPFSFSLLTAAALAPRTTPRYEVCAVWCAINVAFEIGQHPVPARHLAGLGEAVLGDAPLARVLANYFVRGTFDPGDIAAALLGAVAAAGVMRLLAFNVEAEHAE